MSALEFVVKLLARNPDQINNQQAVAELAELVKRNEYLESVVTGIVKSTGANTATEALMRFSQLRAELDEARRIMGPFAKSGNEPNDWPITEQNLICQIAYLDCKAASEWLKKQGDKE